MVQFFNTGNNRVKVQNFFKFAVIYYRYGQKNLRYRDGGRQWHSDGDPVTQAVP